MYELQAASVRNKVGLGKRRGEWIRRIGSIGLGEAPELTGPLCSAVSGFSLHAAVYCAPHERQKLEQLCRYIARPAIAEERLKLLPNQDILLKLKKPYSDGTSHLVFSPLAQHASFPVSSPGPLKDIAFVFYPLRNKNT